MKSLPAPFIFVNCYTITRKVTKRLGKTSRGISLEPGFSIGLPGGLAVYSVSCMRGFVAEFRLRDWIQPGGYYGALVYGVLFFGLAFVLGRAVRIGVRRLLEKDKHRLIDRTTVSFLAQLARIAIYVFAFVSY